MSIYEKQNDKNSNGFSTLAIHAGQPSDASTGAVMTPVYLTSTYHQSGIGQHQGYEYSRTDNPTRTAYQKCVAALEGGKYGLAFSSGMASIDTVMRTLKTGDHVISCDDVYGGTFRLFDKVYRKMGYQFNFVDCSDLALFEQSFTPATKWVWLETPTNPLLKVLDLSALIRIAHQKGAKVAVDNTFISPYYQQPLQLGADLVSHSVTKYLNGHSDVVGGVLVTNDETLYKDLKFIQNAVGAVPGPMDCFLVMRGIKTLALRMERHAKNAMEIARFLEAHPAIEKVLYPGLPSHPQHELATRQMRGPGGLGYGGMISFYLKTGTSGPAMDKVNGFLKRLRLFTLAESLGGVESLIGHPATMTHASIPVETRHKIGILDNLIRISVGIEDLEDLKRDLSQALG